MSPTLIGRRVKPMHAMTVGATAGALVQLCSISRVLRWLDAAPWGTPCRASRGRTARPSQLVGALWWMVGDAGDGRSPVDHLWLDAAALVV